jgi:hypothetical protein
LRSTIARCTSTAQRAASTDAREFHQHAVARGLDDAPAVFRDFRIHHLAAMRLEAFERRFLGRSHQPRVARHIGGEDGGETAFDRLLHGPPPAQRS